jgi:hypothetical protein
MPHMIKINIIVLAIVVSFCDALKYKSYVDTHYFIQHKVWLMAFCMPFESKSMTMQMWCSMCLSQWWM